MMTITEQTEAGLVSNKRREERSIISSLVFPLLGSREQDHAFFQYLPIDNSPAGLQLMIPKWVVNRDRLRIGDRINLHVAFRFGDAVYSEAIVVWARWDEEAGGQRCGVAIDKNVRVYYPLFIEWGTGSRIDVDLHDFNTADELFYQIIKDAILLKKGVHIYLKHLASYFSRIVDVSTEDYRQIKTLLFEDMDNRVRANQAKLEALYEIVQNRDDILKKMARFVDLEELRRMMESEIYIDVLRSALATDTVMLMINAIKTLEKKQFANYNAIVMLYVRSL